MNKKCETCNWNFNDTCVHESEDVFIDKTQHTEDCIGWLDKNHENKLRELAEILIFVLGEKDREVVYSKTYDEMLMLSNILGLSEETKQ